MSQEHERVLELRSAALTAAVAADQLAASYEPTNHLNRAQQLERFRAAESRFRRLALAQYANE